MPETVFAVYSRLPDANELRRELEDAGVRPDRIEISSEPGTMAASDIVAGVPDKDAAFYRESLERGRIVVKVHASDAQAEKISQVLDRYGPINQHEVLPSGEDRRP